MISTTNKPNGTALVTGATGFLGSAVVRQLRGAGAPVRCLVRATSRVDRLDGLGVEMVTGDVRDLDGVGAAVVGCDSVIHLAGPSGWSTLDSPTVTRDIVEGMGSVLEAAQRAGVRRVTHVSTAAVLGPSDCPTPREETSPESPVRPGLMPYLEAKRTAEEMCRQAFG
ncbi:MAG: NAD-dependent epimerase/dehydratase family protein, partial [Planctomycetaceae bacterium]|nr:NAD-dependent epimerase/dehydratase family protein [Planctomycetaceae bacterium]